MRIACFYLESPLPQTETLHALAEACFRFTPQIALGERAVFLEIGASHRLFSEQLLTMRLDRLAKRFGFLSRVTFGGSAGEALALARYPSFLYARDLPLESLTGYAFPFVSERGSPDPEAVKKIAELIRTLKLLGLKTVGELATLPPPALASRFGKEALKLGGCVRAEGPGRPGHGEAWPGFHPSPRVLEKAPVENSETLEAILFVLRGLADRIIARLYGRGERASVLNIRFDLVKWGSRCSESGKALRREFKLSLPLAQGSVSGLIPIMRDYLSQRLESEPFDAPVDSVQLEVLETVPSRSAQRDFFSKKEEEAETWDALVARLAQKLGKDRVFTAIPERRYLPEKAYSRSLKRASPGPKGQASEQPFWPPRPTRLLAHPRILGTLGASSLEGPERLSGEWWDSQYEGFNRDYYRLKTASGEELWVFLNRNMSRAASSGSPKSAEEEVLYLHGYFD